MRHVICSASCLAALRPGHDYRPALDEIAALGFSAVRVFAGRLSWCGQEPHHALERLPQFKDDANDRGLNVHAVALTDTKKDGREAFDRVLHVNEVSIRLDGFDILERGNEPWDQEQFELSSDYLADMPRANWVADADGASQDDEDASAYTSGQWVTRHLDRGRPEWNMVRRVQELRTLSEKLRKPVMSGEPIGAGEAYEPGKRNANPSIFYTMAALGQLFGVSTCFHSSDGLLAQPLGPRQRQCAEAFIAGMRVMPIGNYEYKNVGHAGSPVASATFNDGNMNKQGCTRSYSGLRSDVEATNVTLGVSGNAELVYGNGWRPADELGRMPGVVVTRVTR